MPPVPAAVVVGAILIPATVEVPVVFTEPLVNVRFSRYPVAAAAGARELLASVFMFPVVVVEVIDVVPYPVIAVDPEVPVRLKAPVVRASPFDAVSVPAEVIVPDPDVEIFPEVVTASPAVVVLNVVPLLDQYPMTPLVGAVEVRFFEPSV